MFFERQVLCIAQTYMSFVEAVIFAEFDIDKGSICRVQYPRDVGDPGLLAELMLPEGAHNHGAFCILSARCAFSPAE